MKRMMTAMILTAMAGTASLSKAHADDEWHHHGHGHPHGPPWAREYYYPQPVYYSAQPQVIYREVPVYQPYRGGLSETIPMVASGILGGVVGDQAGRGNPAAVIGGSVLGSVLGHEIAR